MAIRWRRRTGTGGADGPGDGPVPAGWFPPPPPCACCGAPLDRADPRFDLELPQPVAALDAAAYARHVTTANDAIVVTTNLGGFTRALLPVALDDGRTTTVGVWVSVEPDVFRHVVEVGSGRRDYDEMQFDGRLANGLDPWGEAILGAPVSAGVDVPTSGRRPKPRITASPHRLLGRVLAERWPAAAVLGGPCAWAVPFDPAAPRVPHDH